MSEIAKCPLCGNSPVIFPTFDPAEYCPEATECCGAAFTTVRAWNQYAAAMELAKAESKMARAIEDCAAFDCARIDLSAAKMRVLEVFK